MWVELTLYSLHLSLILSLVCFKHFLVAPSLIQLILLHNKVPVLTVPSSVPSKSKKGNHPNAYVTGTYTYLKNPPSFFRKYSCNISLFLLSCNNLKPCQRWPTILLSEQSSKCNFHFREQWSLLSVVLLLFPSHAIWRERSYNLQEQSPREWDVFHEWMRVICPLAAAVYFPDRDLLRILFYVRCNRFYMSASLSRDLKVLLRFLFIKTLLSGYFF